MPRTTKQSFNFEKALAELKQLVEKMEQGELSLEDSLKDFEHGITLVRECQQALKHAEQKVQILLEKNGQPQVEEFNTNLEGDG